MCILATDPSRFPNCNINSAASPYTGLLAWPTMEITFKREHVAACSVLKLAFVVDEPETGSAARIQPEYPHRRWPFRARAGKLTSSTTA